MQQRNDVRVIVVFGATGGIGKVIVRELYNRGHMIVLSSRTESKLSDFAREFDEADRILVAPGDITSLNSVKLVLSDARGEFGRVDAVINTSGTWDRVTMDTPLESAVAIAESHIKQHALGCFIFSDVFQRYFRGEKKGLIANISSHAGMEVDLPGNATYAPAKAYAQHRMATLAHELKVKETGVRVVDIVPAIVNTPELAHLLTTEEMRNGAVQPEAIATWFADNLDNHEVETQKMFGSSIRL